MTQHDGGAERIIATLREREKELHCLYAVHELLSRPDAPVADVCRELVEVLPSGWQSRVYGNKEESFSLVGRARIGKTQTFVTNIQVLNVRHNRNS